jgi:hypothetical protein
MPYLPPVPEWMPGDEAIQHIQAAERSTEALATDQLKTAIAHRAVGVRVLEWAIPKELEFFAPVGPGATSMLSPGVCRQPPAEAWAEADVGADGMVAFGPDTSRYRFEVLRENVLRIWPNRQRSTSAAEKACLKWLLQDLQERGTSTVSKTERRSFARGEFGISHRAFDRVWTEAVEKSGYEEASRGGRKRKSTQKIDTPKKS